MKNVTAWVRFCRASRATDAVRLSWAGSMGSAAAAASPSRKRRSRARHLQGVGDDLPGFCVARFQNAVKPRDEFARLVVEQAQDLRVERCIAPVVAGQVGKIDSGARHEQVLFEDRHHDNQESKHVKRFAVACAKPAQRGVEMMRRRESEPQLKPLAFKGLFG